MNPEEITKADVGIAVAVAGTAGAAAKWLFDSLIRFLRMRSQNKDADTERELKLTHSTLEYAETLKQHVARLEEKVDALQAELSEMHGNMKSMYEHGDRREAHIRVLEAQNKEFAAHIGICGLQASAA